MIQEEVVYQEAKKENLEAKQSDVDSKFKQLKASIEKDKDYAKFLKDNNIDDEFLKTQLKKDLSIENYKKVIIEDLNRVYTSVDTSSLSKTKNKFDKETEISEEAMKKYYEDNKSQFTEDKVRASHILISTVDKDGKELSPEKKKEAKKEAEEIYKKVKAGEDFATLAKEYSQDEYSAVNGGDLGFFEKGQMVPEFEAAAFGLKKGEVSEIVESQYGYHIIKLEKKLNIELIWNILIANIMNIFSFLLL